MKMVQNREASCKNALNNASKNANTEGEPSFNFAPSVIFNDLVEIIR